MCHWSCMRHDERGSIWSLGRETLQGGASLSWTAPGLSCRGLTPKLKGGSRALRAGARLANRDGEGWQNGSKWFGDRIGGELQQRHGLREHILGSTCRMAREISFSHHAQFEPENTGSHPSSCSLPPSCLALSALVNVS